MVACAEQTAYVLVWHEGHPGFWAWFTFTGPPLRMLPPTHSLPASFGFSGSLQQASIQSIMPVTPLAFLSYPS
jgi:hypothetical protein